MQKLGPWKVIQQIGRGGQARVFKCQHEDDHTRLAAVKVFSGEWDKDRYDEGVSTEVKRWQREVRLLEQLEHPNVVGIQGSGEDPVSGPWLAMDLVLGLSLADLARNSADATIRNHKSPASRLDQQVLPVAKALAHCHQLGIAHRDIKLDNVMVTLAPRTGPQGEYHIHHPVLVDFGVAYTEHEQRLTRNEVHYAHGWFPPEIGLMIDWDEGDAPPQVLPTTIDVFQVGVLISVVAAGKRPKGTHSLDLSSQWPDAPPKLVRLVEMCTAEHPANRPSMGDVADRLGLIVAEMLGSLPTTTSLPLADQETVRRSSSPPVHSAARVARTPASSEHSPQSRIEPHNSAPHPTPHKSSGPPDRWANTILALGGALLLACFVAMALVFVAAKKLPEPPPDDGERIDRIANSNEDSPPQPDGGGTKVDVAGLTTEDDSPPNEQHNAHTNGQPVGGPNASNDVAEPDAQPDQRARKSSTDPGKREKHDPNGPPPSARRTAPKPKTDNADGVADVRVQLEQPKPSPNCDASADCGSGDTGLGANDEPFSFTDGAEAIRYIEAHGSRAMTKEKTRALVPHLDSIARSPSLEDKNLVRSVVSRLKHDKSLGPTVKEYMGEVCSQVCDELLRSNVPVAYTSAKDGYRATMTTPGGATAYFHDDLSSCYTAKKCINMPPKD